MEKPTFNLWQTVRDEAQSAAAGEPMLASFLHMTVLRHDSLERVLAFHLSSKLGNPTMDMRTLYELYLHALSASRNRRGDAGRYGGLLRARPGLRPILPAAVVFQGFPRHSGAPHQHCLWKEGRKTLAYFLQNRASEVFGVDVHPAARFGRGIMIDHGTGVVIGETAVLGDDISILHGVTLGGSGKEGGDRHPKIGSGVMIGANASVLGNIRVGECAKIGAGSVVVADVPPFSTVVGVPAKAVGNKSRVKPAAEMNQNFFEEVHQDFYI